MADARWMHVENAPSGIVVKEFGKLNDLNPWHPSNALRPIDVTDSGITSDWVAKHS